MTRKYDVIIVASLYTDAQVMAESPQEAEAQAKRYFEAHAPEGHRIGFVWARATDAGEEDPLSATIATPIPVK